MGNTKWSLQYSGADVAHRLVGDLCMYVTVSCFAQYSIFCKNLSYREQQGLQLQMQKNGSVSPEQQNEKGKILKIHLIF